MLTNGDKLISQKAKGSMILDGGLEGENFTVNYSLGWHDIEKRIANIFAGFRKLSPVVCLKAGVHFSAGH